MIEFKPRMWTLMGVSAMALVGAAACQPGGEAGTSAADGEKAAASSTAGEGEGEGAKPAPAPAAARAGGESGEAGAANAYSNVDPASWLGLRVSHLSGFLLVAQKSFEAGQVDEASVLIAQGLLEVYQPDAAELDSKVKDLKPSYEAVVAAIDGKKSKAEIDAAFAKAFKVTQAAQSSAAASDSDVIKGMLGIASGLYSGVVHPDGNDPTEYQHAYGAVLAAEQAFKNAQGKLASKDEKRTAQLAKDVVALVALFPSVTIPEAPAATAAVTAAASRAELALSGIK
ncbi:hypothetical protein MCERH10_01216 [Caulobacteraceae bacterium]|eukprot:gene6161-8490_t